MGGSPSDDDAADRCSTVVAGLVGAAEDSDEVLLLALRAVDACVVAERCAAVGDSVLQRLLDGRVKSATFGRAQRTGRGFGV